MANGTRLSAQNYCTHCEFRIRLTEEKKTVCTRFIHTPVNVAMKTCGLLEPFEKYREYKMKK